MYKLFITIFITGYLLSCKGDNTSYVYYGHWLTPDPHNLELIKANPVEVEESLYVELNDTTFNASGKFNNHDLYKFDKNGNIVFYKIFMADGSFSELSIDYSRNGIQSTLSRRADSSAKPDFEIKIVSEKAGANSFKETHFENGVYRYHEIITFVNRTEVKHEKRRYDTVIWVMTKFFENDLVKKEEIMSLTEKGTSIYYYSGRGRLDSIVTVLNNQQIKKIFTRNEQGDAIAYQKIEAGKKAEARHMKYEYDTKGNWIKKISYEESKAPGTLPPGQQLPGYSMVIREINY